MTTETKKQQFHNKFHFVGSFEQWGEGKLIKSTTNDKKTWTRHYLRFVIKSEDKKKSQTLQLEYGHRPGETPFFYYNGKKVSLSERNKIADMPSWQKIVVDLETDFDKKSAYTQKIFDSYSLRADGNDADADALLAEVDIEATNRFSFVHVIDAMETISENIDKYKDDFKVSVKGRINPHLYNGNVRLDYEVQEFELVPKDTPDQFAGYVALFFGEDCVMDDAVEETGKYNIQAYIQGYSSPDREARLFPINANELVLLHPTVDDESLQEKIDNRVNFFLEHIFGSAEDYFKIAPFELSIIRGTEESSEAEVDESSLTPFEIAAIAAGAATKKNVKGFSQNIFEYRIAALHTKMSNAFADGAIESEVTYDNLGEFLATDEAERQQVAPSDLKQEPKKEKKEEAKQDALDILDDLFK